MSGNKSKLESLEQRIDKLERIVIWMDNSSILNCEDQRCEFDNSLYTVLRRLVKEIKSKGIAKKAIITIKRIDLLTSYIEFNKKNTKVLTKCPYCKFRVIFYFKKNDFNDVEGKCVNCKREYSLILD